MHNLRKLEIRGVLIGHVKNDAFISAPNMEELDISSVYLTSFDDDVFFQNKKLKKLTCYQCWYLEPLPLALLDSLQNLEYLDLSYSPHSIIGNNSSASRNSIDILPNLKVLNLTCSLVSDHRMCDQGLYQYESPLDPDLLKPLVKLETLFMGKNGLTSWNHRRFESNTNLRSLSMPFNKFKSLTSAMIEDFKQLTYLDIRMNEGDYVLCDMQIVEFFNWANASET